MRVKQYCRYAVITMAFGGLVSTVAMANTAASTTKNNNSTLQSSPTVISQLNDDNQTHDKDVVKNSLLSNPNISLGGYQDSILGMVGELKLASYLFNEQNAAAIELNGGPRIFRFNATYGVALTPKHRVKITAERLDEKLDFDFDSGTVSKWVGQNAVGGDYAYMVDNKYLQSLGLGGYLTKSNSKDLSDAVISGPDNLTYTEHRRIAGATSSNFHTNTSLRLWPYSRLSGGMDFDRVQYDTKYIGDSQDVSGFGGHIKLEQRLIPTVKLTLNSQLRQVERSYTGGLSWLIPSPKDMPLELVLTTGHTNNIANNDKYYSTGLRLNFAFGASDDSNRKRSYSDLSKNGKPESLLDWTRTPAVRMSQVLAVADGSIIANGLSCPVNLPKPTTEERNGETIYKYQTSDGWYGETVDGGALMPQSAHYLNNSGSCVYDGKEIGSVLTLNNDNAGRGVGNGWDHHDTGHYTAGSCDTKENICYFAKKG